MSTHTNENIVTGAPADIPKPKSVSELPQETLDFAAKCFDLARNGDETTLKAYIDAGLPVNLTNSKGNTLLMLAAYNGHASLVRTLHAKGGDPNICNDLGQSPLAGAIFKNEDAVIRALVDANADPRKGSPTAIECARVFKKEDLLDLLSATEEERTRPLGDLNLGPPPSAGA